MENTKWYVLRAVSGQEKKVKQYIEREIVNNKFEDVFAQVLTPTEKVYQVRKSRDGKTKKIAIERNFFPGYVMIQANLDDSRSGEVIYMLKNIPGVLGFLDADRNGPNEKPKPMRDTEVNRILGRMEESDINDIPLETEYSQGEQVKVMDGPFSGFTGIVKEVMAERKKLNVMVTIFGRTTPIELNYVQVQKMS
jgi:transcriptional antiterminator NusG